MKTHMGVYGDVLCCWVAVVAAMGCAATAVGQTAATVPSNYKGPNLTGRCAYIAKEGAFYSGVLTISGYFRFDAEHSFRQYALAHADAGQTPRTFCRWLTKEQMKSTADLDVHATTTSGQPMRSTQVNWTYVPGSGGTGAGAVGQVARGGTQTTANGQSGAGQGASATGGGASSASGGMGSSISDGVNNSKQQMGTAVASGMADATSTAMGAMTGLLHRSKKPAASADAAAPAAQGAGTSADEQAMFGSAPNTAAAATGAPVAGPPGSVGSSVAGPGGKKAAPFLFCHLKASGSEYYSDVFPAGAEDADDDATRAFWKQVAHQYKTGSIPYRDNAVCARAGSEQEALAARQTLMSTAPQRGLAKEKVVDTAWTYMGPDEK